MANKNPQIVLVSDNMMGNVIGLAVTVKSVLDQASRKCDIYIISVGLSPKLIDKLKKSWNMPSVGQITFIDFDKRRLNKFRSTKTVLSKAAYARFYLGKLLPETIEKIIYLDTDLLVTDDICGLYDTDMGAYVVGAVCDVSALVKNESWEEIRRSRFGIKKPEKYFNSGVLLIDLVKWRREGIGEAMIQLAEKNRDLCDESDQAVVNAILQDRYLELDLRWNTSQYLAGSVTQAISKTDGLLKFVNERQHKFQYNIYSGEITVLGAMSEDEKKIFLSFTTKDDDVRAIEILFQNSQLNTDHKGIIHLIGHRKPWHCDYDYKFKSLFYKVLDTTEFCGMRPLSLFKINPLLYKYFRYLHWFNYDMLINRTFRKIRIRKD